MAAGSSSRGYFYGLTQNEHEELLESVKAFHESVVRIIRLKQGKLDATGSAFLVYSGDNKSLFLTCDHNFEKDSEKDKGETFIRLFNGEEGKDYPVAEILRRSDSDDKHDLLLFSVNSVPKRKCLEFSTDEVKEKDRVVILGYVSPTVPIKGKSEQPVLLKEPTPLTGLVATKPYQDKDNEDHEKIFVTCEATSGVSGAPLFKTRKVIGVHLANDKEWRESVSANTVLQVLREWHGLGNDNKDTFETLFEMAYNNFKPSA